MRLVWRRKPLLGSYISDTHLGAKKLGNCSISPTDTSDQRHCMDQTWVKIDCRLPTRWSFVSPGVLLAGISLAGLWSSIVLPHRHRRRQVGNPSITHRYVIKSVAQSLPARQLPQLWSHLRRAGDDIHAMLLVLRDTWDERMRPVRLIDSVLIFEHETVSLLPFAEETRTTYIPGNALKRPELSQGVMQQSNQNK